MCPPSARQTFQALNEDLGIKSPLWSISRGTKETCSGRRPRLVRTWLAVAATPSVAGGRAASALGGDVTGTGATRRHAADPQASEPQKARGGPVSPRGRARQVGAARQAKNGVEKGSNGGVRAAAPGVSRPEASAPRTQLPSAALNLPVAGGPQEKRGEQGRKGLPPPLPAGAGSPLHIPFFFARTEHLYRIPEKHPKNTKHPEVSI